jgi:phosphate transport system permease protein
MRSLHRLWISGEPLIWLTGAALGVSLLLLTGLFMLVFANGLGHFWPGRVAVLSLSSGEKLAGEIVAREEIPGAEHGGQRIKLKRGNRDWYGQDFVWMPEARIEEISYPPDLIVLERWEWGNFYGFVRGALSSADEQHARPVELSRLDALYRESAEIRRDIHRIERRQIQAITGKQELLRLEERRLELKGIKSGPALEAVEQRKRELAEQYQAAEERLDELRARLTPQLLLEDANGAAKKIPVSSVARRYFPNRMSVPAKLGFYLSKVSEFLFSEPREANTEGGIFPAIFGTVLMVFIMSAAVTPLGVLAAIYLREYARQGVIISLIRIAVNNLAGVPSIVFGVFGVGFFIYFVGGTIDRLFYPEALPAPTFGTGGILWSSLTLALLTVPTVIVATEEGLAAMPVNWREAAYALGATKFETLWKVSLPALVPSILTGVILAIARAAGEVAPLMITGVVKHAPSLPLDGVFPFLHTDRKFMHLGFHIYDLGFQSPNVDATRPMVYTTTLLLILIVLALNAVAIIVRNRIRRTLNSGAM